MAQYYHIYNYQSLPCYKVAIFVYGLPKDSRTKMKLANMEYTFTEMMLASILDHAKLLVWMNSIDAEKGRNRPKSVLQTMVGQKKDHEHYLFESGEAFERAYQKLIKGGT